MRIMTLSRRALLAGAACLCVLPRARAADVDNFKPTTPPAPVPDLLFSDAGGVPLRLADYRGKVVVFNAWATWCVPCVKEMPALMRLQAVFDPARVAVLPVSVDRGGPGAVSRFYEKNGITGLPVLMDRELSIPRRLKPRGLPLTLLVDREGREVGRALGEVAWDSSDMLERIRALL